MTQTKTITPRIPESLHQLLKQIADDRNISMNSLCIEKLAASDTRYRVVGDHSNQYYMIPASKYAEWQEFLTAVTSDPATSVKPEWAKLTDGNFTFTNPSS